MSDPPLHQPTSKRIPRFERPSAATEPCEQARNQARAKKRSLCASRSPLARTGYVRATPKGAPVNKPIWGTSRGSGHQVRGSSASAWSFQSDPPLGALAIEFDGISIAVAPTVVRRSARLYVPSIKWGDSPPMLRRGRPDRPGRASNEGELWGIIPKPLSESIRQNRVMQ